MSSRDTIFYVCFYTDATESSFAQKKNIIVSLIQI